MTSAETRIASRRLPVLPLRQTLDKYIKSLAPFLHEDEDRGGPSYDAELKKRVQWANQFEHGLGKVLQDRLLAIDKASPYNWLDDNFWMKSAYLQSRSSLMVNSNWWCVYQPDASILNLPLPDPGEFTCWQVKRAAWLVHKMLQYRVNLENQALRNVHLQDVPFQLPFHRCRVPMDSCDSLAPLPTRGTPESRKIIIMLRDWCYAVQVLDASDIPLPPVEIETHIWNAIYDTISRQEQGEKPVPIGLLTAHDRNAWAKTREHLLNISSENRKSLRAIENSIFVLSLDDYTQDSNGLGESTLLKNVDLDAHIRNASSGIAGHNRWYDKCVSIFVESTSRAGGMGEHSPCDGLVVGALMDYSLSENINILQFERGVVGKPSSQVLGLERLGWVVDDLIEKRCLEAEQHARHISDDSDASMLSFNDYGARWIKDIAKLSPDAYAQMAMQLAWHKAQGEFTATYETATTHMFLRGRTETIRSFSTESWLFVKAMSDPQCSMATRSQRLEDAVRAHNAYARDAIRGRGVDRHLLGLRLVMKEGEEAQIFQDPLFARSETWRLSTSGLFRGERFLGTGFGSPFWDGYGVQYILDGELMKFGVESKRSCPATSTDQYKEALVASLREMRVLCEPRSRAENSARL